MYKCCNLILHGLSFLSDAIGCCCNSPVNGIDNKRHPILFPNYKGEIIPPEQLFEKIHSYRDLFKQGDCHDSCRNCCFIKTEDWDEGDFINEITIANFAACNAKCIYCGNNLSRENIQYEAYKFLPLLKYYKDNGVIKKGVELHISGGEFSIYEECDDLIEEFGVSGFAKIVISSNCIRYSEPIKKSIDVGNTYIINSLDCGSKDLFTQIKGVDVFDKVVSNLKKYADSGNGQKHIILKYIIIPAMNDNLSEFKKFIKLVKNIGAKHVAIEIELRYARDVQYIINPYFIHLAMQMSLIAEKSGLIPEFFPVLQQCMKENPCKKLNIFEIIANRRKINKEKDKIYNDNYVIK